MPSHRLCASATYRWIRSQHRGRRWGFWCRVALIEADHVATERPDLASLYAAVAAAIDDVVDPTGVDVDPWASAWKTSEALKTCWIFK